MNRNSGSLREERINDYLDLYNYAVSIGDAEWQEAILLELERSAPSKRTDRTDVLRNELMRDYETINRTLLDIYPKLSSIEARTERDKLWNQIWMLKRMRVEICWKMQQLEEA